VCCGQPSAPEEVRLSLESGSSVEVNLAKHLPQSQGPEGEGTKRSFRGKAAALRDGYA
jgi:hypothetical protein